MGWAVIWAWAVAALTHGLPLDIGPSSRAFVGFSLWPPEPEVAPVECVAANTLLQRGTCFKAAECKMEGGVASGKCPSGGVCCVVPVLCGGVVKYNNTWFVNKNFPKTTSDPDTCTITIRRTNPKVVQARLDLELLDLGAPRRGRCQDDSFLVSRSSVSQPLTPTLCGNNSRQHLYLDLLPGQVEVKVKLDNSHLLPRQGLPRRQWKVLITQHLQQEAAPHGCLQYHRQEASTVRSLNYDSDHYSGGDLNYDVCFSRLARSHMSEDSCSRQFNNVNMEQHSLNRAVRDNQPASKRRKTNRHSSSNGRGRSGNGSSKRRSGRSVSLPQQRDGREESDPKQYTQEDRVNIDVLDVINLVNKTVDEVRVSSGAAAEEGDHNVIPLILWPQNIAVPTSVNPSPTETIFPDPELTNTTSLPHLAPVNLSVESSSPTKLVPSHDGQDQPTKEERPIQLFPVLESQTNEAVITQIQNVVHQLQQEHHQQQQQDKEKEEKEKEEQYPAPITTTVIQDQTDTTTDPVTPPSNIADIENPLLVTSDIPVTEVSTTSLEPSSNTEVPAEILNSESSHSSMLQDSIEITSGYISVQEDASDATTPYPKTTMKGFPITLPDTQTTASDNRISDVQIATPDTQTTASDNRISNVQTATPDTQTTASDNRISDVQTATPDTQTTTSDNRISDVQTATPDTQTTATDNRISDVQTATPDTQTTATDNRISSVQTATPDTQTTASDNRISSVQTATPDTQTTATDNRISDVQTAPPDTQTTATDNRISDVQTATPDTQTTATDNRISDVQTAPPDTQTTATDNRISDVQTATPDTQTTATDNRISDVQTAPPDTQTTATDNRISDVQTATPDTQTTATDNRISDVQTATHDTQTTATDNRISDVQTATPDTQTTASDNRISDVQTATHDTQTTATDNRISDVQTATPDTQTTASDNRISDVQTATPDTQTTITVNTVSDVTTTLPDVQATTPDDQTSSDHAPPHYTPTSSFDTTTTHLKTETTPSGSPITASNDTTTDIPITIRPAYVPLSNAVTTTPAAVTSDLKLTYSDSQTTSTAAQITSPVTAPSDLHGPPDLSTDPELWGLKETYPPFNVTNQETSVDDVDEMLEKLKDQFLMEYLLNGNQPSEDVGDLFVETIGGTKTEEDTSWVTAGMVVSGAATIPSSTLVQDLTGVAGRPAGDQTVVPMESTTFKDIGLDDDVISIPDSMNFDEYSLKTDSTTDADFVTNAESIRLPEFLTMEKSAEFDPTTNSEFITESTVESDLTTVAYSTTTTTTSGDGGLDVHLTMDVEATPEEMQEIHSELETTSENENNTQTTIDLISSTIVSTTTILLLTPTTTTTTTTFTTAAATTTSPSASTTPTTTFTYFTIVPSSTINDIIPTSSATMTTASSYPSITSSVPQTTAIDSTVTTTTIAFKVTSVTTTTTTTSAATTLISAPATTTPFMAPTTTTTVTLGLSTTYPLGTGDSMQVELTVTDPDSVQVVGDLVMADHQPQSPVGVPQVTPQPTLDDGIEWLILDGSGESVSLPPETVVFSGIGFSSESDTTTGVIPERDAAETQEDGDLVHLAGEGTVTTESLETEDNETAPVQGVAGEVDDSGTFGATPLYKPQDGVTEGNESTVPDNGTSAVTSTESAGDITVAEVVEASSSGNVTITKTTVDEADTSQKVVEATSSHAADGASVHSTVAPTGSLTALPAVHASSPLTTPSFIITTSSTTTTSYPTTSTSSPTTSTSSPITTSATTSTPSPTTTSATTSTPSPTTTSATTSTSSPITTSATTSTPSPTTTSATTSTSSPITTSATTSTSSPITTSATTSASFPTNTFPTTTTPFLTTTSASTTVTTSKANLGVHININVHDTLSEVELTDPNENNIEATIDLITNSDDDTFLEDDDSEDDNDIFEIFNESEEDSEPVIEEPVCGGAYVLVRQRMLCGGQLRISLPPDQNIPDDRFENIERFSVHTLNGATRSLRFSLDYKTSCPRAPPPPTKTPSKTPIKKTVTLLQYLLGWYR